MHGQGGLVEQDGVSAVKPDDPQRRAAPPPVRRNG
jgi:hypothetical protein